MKMLYDSDSFVVVHMLPDAGLSDSAALQGASFQDDVQQETGA